MSRRPPPQAAEKALEARLPSKAGRHWHRTATLQRFPKRATPQEDAMTKPFCTLAMFSCGLAAFHSAAYSTEPVTESQVALDDAFQLIKEAVARGDVPGGVALVARNGKILREEAYGLCDVENKVPFMPDTICWIASITKPVTVASAMKLVELGKLGLDDKVEDYLPEFKAQKDKDNQHQPITIRQLMCHTSGLLANPPTRPGFFFDQAFLGRKIADISTAIAETPLQFSPGSQVLYSNAAPYVLGRIIELQSGQPFHQHVQKTILDPAGMNDTYFIIPSKESARVAVVYRDTKEGRVTFFRFDPEWKITMTLPDGGLFSSPRQIMKFVQLFLDDNGTVLSPESVRAMRTQQAPGWGLGWELKVDGSFSHSGSSGTAAWADPNTGVVGILFFQLQNNEVVLPLQSKFKEAVRAAFSVTVP
jgi:CubicO group peptidase (beta-lactamase class C family)